MKLLSYFRRYSVQLLVSIVGHCITFRPNYYVLILWLMVLNCFQDAAVHPSLVIVYFGGNDAMKPHPSGLGPHVPLPEYIDNMKKISLHLMVTH